MGCNLLYSVLIIIPVGWWIINFYYKFSLYRQVYQLENSFEVQLDFVHLSKNILLRVMKVTKASAGIIYWYDEAQNKFKLKSLQGIPADKLNQITKYLTKKSGLLEHVGNNHTGILIKNKKNNSIGDHTVNEFTDLYSSMLVVPLNTSKQTVGILVLFKSGVSFNKRDQHLLELFAPRTAIQLDHSRLFHLATDTALENAKLYINISKLYHKVILDDLTGLYNRHFLMQKLKEEINKAFRFKQPLSLIFTDIDLFKQVNDQYGHSAGDQVLYEFGELLRKSIREYDLACRFGGEEFVILLPQTDSPNALFLAERLREKIAESLFCKSSIRIKITASFGVGTIKDLDSGFYNPGDEDLINMSENLLAWADDALYRAKKAGRNIVVNWENELNPIK